MYGWVHALGGRVQFGNVFVLATVQAVIQIESKTKYHAGKLSKQVILNLVRPCEYKILFKLSFDQP